MVDLEVVENNKWDNLILPQILIDDIDNLSYIEKYKTWLHYYGICLKTKMYTVICDNINNNGYINPYSVNTCKINFPYKKLGFINIYYVGLNFKILEFREFINKENNIKIIDNGINWKQRSWAQRYIVQLTGIYEHYSKFKNKIK